MDAALCPESKKLRDLDREIGRGSGALSHRHIKVSMLLLCCIDRSANDEMDSDGVVALLRDLTA